MRPGEDGRMVCGKDMTVWRKLITDVMFKRRRYRDMDYSASLLAQELGLSPSALSRLLRSVMGCNYTDLVNSRRVEEAIKILSNARYYHYTVDEVGLMVGFRNRQSFFTAFVKHAGTTPQRYRDENNNK